MIASDNARELIGLLKETKFFKSYHTKVIKILDDLLVENEDLTNLLKQAHHVYDGDLFKVSQDQGIAVSTGTYLMPISEKTPRNAKIQLLGRGGVLVYGMWDGKSDFWTDWAPLPRRRSE